MFDVSREDIAGGSLVRAVLVLAGPLVAQNFALVAQSVVDLFWVGRLGGTAVAAVGLASVVVALLVVPLQAFFTGGQVVTSQRVGADETASARRVPFTTAACAIGVAGVLGVALVGSADVVSGLFTGDRGSSPSPRTTSPRTRSRSSPSPPATRWRAGSPAVATPGRRCTSTSPPSWSI